jgi:fibronectin-binding autotransporter adhesin
MPLSTHMKSRRNVRPVPLAHSVIAAFAVILTPGAHAAVDNWVGNTSVNWNGLNWAGGNNPPVDGDALVFDLAGTAGPVLNNDLAPLFNVAGITFNSLASPFTFNGNAITLTGNVSNLSTSLQTINLPMDLPAAPTATRTFTMTTGGGDIVLGGILSGAGGITAAGAGTLNLRNTANTFTNEIAIGGGVVNTAGAVLNVASLSDYGVASSIGARLQSQEVAAGNGIGLHFRSGTLQYTGSTPQSTNREIRIQNGTLGGTIDASGSTPTATLSFTHTGPNINLFDTGGTRTLTLTGTNTGANSFSIRLTNQATNQTSLRKAGTGTWFITNTDNTYTGETIFAGGTLNLASLSDYGVESSIGPRTLAEENTTVTGVSLHFQGGTLQYTGSTPQSTNRNIRVLNGNGGTIDASGSNPNATLSFTHTGANINLFDTAGTRTLTLTGTNTGNNSFSIVIANQAGSATSLAKTGAGTWVLNGPDTNTATGSTSVTGGLLVLSKTAATAVSGPLMIGDAVNSSVVLLSGTGGNQIADGSVVSFNSGGAGGAILRMNNINETVAGLSSVGGGIVENESGVAGTATITVTVPATVSQTFDGTLRNGNGAGVDGTLALAKAGAGNLTLAGASTHTGATNVSAGSLTVSGSLTGSAVTVSSATLDGGGTINGAITIENNGIVDSIGTFNGTVTVNNGGRLSGTSTTVGTVNTAGGSRISPGGPTAVGTLTIGSLNLAAGALLDFEFGAHSDMINVTVPGGLALNGGAFNLFNTGGTTPLTVNGTYNLLDYSGSFTGALGNLSIANSQVGKFYNIVNNAANTVITLTVSDTTISEWNGGAANGLWTTAGNWTAGTPNSAGAVAKFGPIPTTATAVAVNGAKTVGGILFDNANAYTINGAAADTITVNNGVAAASITVTTGNHTIAAPLVLATSANVTTSLGTMLTISGNITGAKPFLTSGSGTVVLLGAANAFSTTTVSGGTLQVGNNGTTGTLGTGDVTLANGSNLIFNRSDSFTLANNIFGTGGQITKLGAGTVTLSGANTFGSATGGGVNLNAGTVKLGAAGGLGTGVILNFNGGTLDLNGNGVTAGLVNGATGSITDNGSGAGTTALTINQAVDSIYGGTITNGAGRTVSVTKAGAGSLTLTGANTFTGPLAITNGTVIAAGAGNNVPIVSNVTIGDGSETVWLIAGAPGQQFGAGTVLTFSNGAKNAKFQLRGSNQMLAGLESTADPTTALTIIQNDETTAPGYAGDPGPATLTLNTTADHVFAGLIRNQNGGGLSLVKEGPATQEIRNILVGTSNYGSATINAGKLVLNFFPNGLGTNNIPLATSIIVNSAGTLGLKGTTVVNGPISGDGTILVEGQDTVTLTGVNTFTKGITLNSGTLGVGGDQSLGDPTGVITVNGGILRASGAARQIANPVVANGSFTLGRLTHLNGGITLNANATITANNFDAAANNPSNIGAITGNFRVSFDQGPQGIGTGALVITGQNTNSGGTAILSGRVNVVSGGALSNAPLTLSGGELNMSSPAQTVASFSGTAGTLNLMPGHVLTVDQATDSTFGGVLGNSGSLTKSGAGALTLTGTSNGFLGAVNVTAGALLVNGSMSATLPTVTGGRLGGTGTVGAVTLDNGTLAPGVTTGILNTGPLEFRRGTVEFQINGVTPGTDYDQINVTGGITLVQDINLVLAIGLPLANGEQFILFNNDSTDVVIKTGLLTVSGNTLTEGEEFAVGSQPLRLTYAGGSDANDIVLMAIPEPGSAGLVCGLSMLLGLCRRRLLDGSRSGQR